MAIKKRGLSLSELASSSLKDFSETVSSAGCSSLDRIDNQLEWINAQIKELEDKYNISSNQMIERLSQGEQMEDSEICSWQILLKARSRCHAAKSPQSRSYPFS